MTQRRPTLVLAMDPLRTSRVLSDAARRRLEALCDVADAAPLQSFDTDRAKALLARAEILVTGWGCPPLTPAVLDLAPGLRLVAHTAGTVRYLTGPEIFARGIRITQAADANAVPVAEYTLAAILFANKAVFGFRDLYRADRSRRRTDLLAASDIGNFGRTIGIVGASRVGRRVIAMLGGFELDILVHDPLLGADDPVRKQARPVDLDTLLAQSDIVSLHAPLLPQTRGMIGARELGLMRDGVTFINTARGAIVDQEALIAELTSGRLNAVLDVTFPEVPEPASPLYDLPNVVLTPHVAGTLGSEQQRLGDLIVDEVARHARGEPLRHAITAETFAHLA